VSGCWEITENLAEEGEGISSGEQVKDREPCWLGGEGVWMSERQGGVD